MSPELDAEAVAQIGELLARVLEDAWRQRSGNEATPGDRTGGRKTKEVAGGHVTALAPTG